MDCQACQGTGEMGNIEDRIKADSDEEIQSKRRQGRGLWPYACPVCGGSGFLEQ